MKKNTFRFPENGKLVVLLSTAFLLRLLFVPYGTLQNDFNTFVAWSDILVSQGFGQFYQRWSDYLPGYLYALFILGEIKKIFGFEGLFLYKLPAVLADLATAYLVYRWVLRIFPNRARLAAGLYLFNPAVFANSALWGQVDGLIPFFALAAFLTLSKNLYLSALMLAVGALVKPQVVFVAPLAFWLVWQSRGFFRAIKYAFVCLVIFLLGFMPFAGSNNLFLFVLERLSVSSGQYPYTSINAFNFWAMTVGFWQADKGYFLLGLLAVAVSVLLAVKALDKGEKPFVMALSLVCVFLATFLFLTRVHERHLLPVLAPLAVAASGAPLLWLPYLLLSITYIANLYYSHVWLSQEFAAVFSEGQIKLIAFVNLLSFFLVIIALLKPEIVKIGKVKFSFWSRLTNAQKTSFVKVKSARGILLAIIIFAFVSRLFYLWHPDSYYFDEVYHAFTAGEIAKGNSEAWEYWADPPEGVAYEWTHPPLAKLVMAGSIFVLGQQPFAWRLPGAIFGIYVLILIFYLVRLVFQNERLALFAAALLTLEGLVFTLSRIGMNDIYFLFFSLLTILLFFKDKYFFSAIALGLAVSTKWTGMFLLPILFLAWILYKRKLLWQYFWFLLLAPVVYLASYFDFFLTGHTVAQWKETQQQMWWYHSKLTATHDYASPWWSWPLLIRPLWAFTQNLQGSVANIYFLGNPVIFYTGFASVLFVLLNFFKGLNKNLVFFVSCYFVFFLPWAFSPRVMFVYHYAPAVPFLVIILAWVLERLYLSGQKKIVFGFFVLCALAFVYFYPHLIGLLVSEWWDRQYYWLPSWR